MEELVRLFRSFRYAVRGIGYGIRTQRNMRIHLSALLTVCIAGGIARLSVTHWCIVLLCCMAVISLELVNTALEAACDSITRETCPLIGHAKDAAAGAVLVSAIGSLVIGLKIFFQGYGDQGDYYLKFAKLWRLHPVCRILLVLWCLGIGLFVFLPCYLQKKKEK
jgi:diacylglycerol kinase